METTKSDNKATTVKSVLKDAEEAKWGYMIGDKRVSEFKFFQKVKQELSGKPVKKTFYWTDQKVLLLLKAFGVKITAEDLAVIKKNNT